MEEVVEEPMEEIPMEEEMAPTDVHGCIAANAILYGTGWSSDTRAAREEFQDTSLTYVACDDDPEACTAAGVEGFPTWEINGDLYPGRMSIDQLAALAGCQ